MSKRDRRDSDGRDRDRRDGDRRDYQPEDEGQRRMGEGELQEGDSVTALKAILSKVASQLKPLNLTADESIRLVEQLYGSVLEMDLALAGETDDTRKASTLAYIRNTTIRRDADRLVVEFPNPEDLRAVEHPSAEPGPAVQREARTEVTAVREPGSQASASQTSAPEIPVSLARGSETPRAEAPPQEKEPAEPAPRPRGPRPRQPRSERTQQAPGHEDGEQRQTASTSPGERGSVEREEPEGPKA